MRKNTQSALTTARVEKDVENAYRAEVSHHRPEAQWTSPHGTDGHAAWGTVRLLLEAKFDQDLKTKLPVCNVLGQMILYLKKFERAGEVMPNVLFVGDKDECFVLATDAVRGFLNLGLDYDVAPSKGSPELTRALVNGFNLLPYVYDVNGDLDFKDVLAKVETLARGAKHSAPATPTNLGAIFLYWRDNVFTGKEGTAGALTPTEQVDVFLRCLFQPTDVYTHPTKRGVLVVPGYPEGVTVSTDAYRSFFDHFAQGYKPSEIEAFYAMKDRLVEDDARRRQGAFFTPRLWVDEAHKELDRVLGKNWRKDCVVWDSAAGTANLTRDYTDFKYLISSTAERPDVQVMQEQRWGGTTFQYDFLNPGTESPFFDPKDGGTNTLPNTVDTMLREAALSGKRLVFLMNPPYGTANNAGTEEGDHKAGIALTATNVEMKKAKLGAPSQQLYAQFMYRCKVVAREYGFKDSTVALFSVPTFMSSGSYRPFREWWYNSHAYAGGFLFQASHFADVSGRWGISFTVWNEGGTTNKADTLSITLKDEQGFTVTSTGTKAVYNADDREASEWVREPIKGIKGVDAPQMSSGLKVKEEGRGSLAPNALYFFGNNANNLIDSATLVYNVSSADTRNNGLSVLSSNWRRAVALYAARKLVLEAWDTQKDEYLRPDEGVNGYSKWVDDCHIYALLHNANNCTAMRDVQYKGKSWRVKNHWFWRTRASTLKALDAKDTPTLYRDCKAEPTKEEEDDVLGFNPPTSPWEQTGDSYLAHALCVPSLKFSPDAKEVLDLLDALWVKSLPLRENYAAGKPELHLTAWDAGIYQLKHLWRDLFPAEWAELQTASKALSERLRPGVYTYGFLKP
mgnify:CR=1 FL=1